MQEKKFVPTKFWEIFKLRPPIITVGGRGRGRNHGKKCQNKDQKKLRILTLFKQCLVHKMSCNNNKKDFSTIRDQH